MMHNNENYYFWGMHAGWWIFAFVVIVAVLVWFGRFRNKNDQAIHLSDSKKV